MLQIKKSNLIHIDRRRFNIMPTLSYMTMDRSNYSQFQFELVDDYRNGISQLGNIPVAHCTTLTPEDTFELEMKDVSQIDKEMRIKIEVDPADQALNEHKSWNVNRTHQNNIRPKALIAITNSRSDNLTFEMDQNGDDFQANNDFGEVTDAEDEKFEPVSCKLNNKVEGVRYSDKCGDVVPITVKEAKAAVEVHKYTSLGPYRCHCGKGFVMEKNFKTHRRRHDLVNTHVIGCKGVIVI